MPGDTGKGIPRRRRREKDPRGRSLRPIKLSAINRSTVLFLAFALFIIALSGLTQRTSLKEAYAAAEMQTRIHRLGDAMEDASNLLTESVKSFVATLDREEMGIYWREMEVDRRRELAIAVLGTMRLPAEEEALLLRAKGYSDELAEREIRAILLAAEAAGLPEDVLPPGLARRGLEPADALLSPAAKLERARELVFGLEYSAEKAEILGSIEDFRNRAADRTAAATRAAQAKADEAFRTEMLLLGFFLLAGAGAVVLQYLLVAAPIRNYTETLALPPQGSLRPDFRPSGAEELVTLALAFNARKKERDAIEVALRDSELHLRSHLEFMPLAAIEVDESGRIVMWNPAAERIFGYPAAEALGRRVEDLVVPESERPAFQEVVERLGRGERIESRRTRNSTKGGREILCEWYDAPLFDSTGRRLGWSSVVQDVTERQREADEILYLSRHDPLTGLFNRRHFQERLEEERQRWRRSGKPFSLIMADIDLFKGFNDSYGHECGDLVLRSLSEVMLNSLRETDSVGRWGGEEFIVLLPETGPEGARELAEKLRKMVESLRIGYGGAELGVTITAGYASYRGGELDDCIRQADSALLQGKASGRNVVVGG